MTSFVKNGRHSVLRMFSTKNMSVANRRRAQDIQLIVRGMTDEGMTTEEIHELLECSMSGTQRYIRDLQLAGLIQVRSESISQGILVTRYGLTADSAMIGKIREWTPDSAEPSVDIRPRKRGPQGAGLRSKAVLAINVSRDPLVEALFGPPRLRQ
jgi:predicted transcriptional regulator